MEVNSGHRLRARLHLTKENTLRGWAVGAFGGLGLLACVYSSSEIRYLFVGLTLALWGGGGMLAWRPRAQIVLPTLTDAGVQVGTIVVPWGAAAQIAKGRRGASVAFGWGDGEGAFFEVAGMEDARALVAMAGADEGRAVALRLRFDKLRGLTAVLGGVAAMCGLGYAVAVGILGDSGSKGTFGLPGLVFAIAATFLYLIAQLARQTVVVGAPASADGVAGAIGRHLDLHAKDAGHRATRGPAHGDDANDGTPPRVRIMLRENEPTRAWLARIDGAADGGEGYRGLAPSREDLDAVLSDVVARPDLRLAAARVLVRRHGAGRDQVLAKLDSQLSTYGRLVVDDDLDRAADDMDRLGPIFMASLR